MGRKKSKRGECSDFKSSVPLEIVTEILKRVPAESIMRCKCVCKAWNSLLNDNYFLKLHVARSQSNASQSHILFESSPWTRSQTKERYLLNLDNRKVKRIRAYPHVRDKTRVATKTLPVMSSLHGLICCSTFWYKPEVVIYNPLIRGDYIILPKSKHGPTTLGFDYSINMYKVVRSMGDQSDDSPTISGCEVFTIGKDTSWRQVQFPYREKSFYNRGTFHQGSIYWMIRGAYKGCLLEFDLAEEVFSMLSFPSSIRQLNYGRHPIDWDRFQLHSSGEYLSITERERLVVHIWKLVKQKTGIKLNGYSKMELQSPYEKADMGRFIYLNSNLDLLLLQTKYGFTRDNNGKRIQLPATNYTFYRPTDPNKHNRLTNLPNLQSKFAVARSVQAWSFTPSLVSIKDAMLSCL